MFTSNCGSLFHRKIQHFSTFAHNLVNLAIIFIILSEYILFAI